MGKTLTDTQVAKALFNSIRSLIDQSKKRVALTVNQEMTLLNWRIGQHINDTLLKEDRAEYGQAIVATLSQQLTAAYGAGFTTSSPVSYTHLTLPTNREV